MEIIDIYYRPKSKGRGIFMAIIISYSVDRDLYYDPQTNHNISLITTEYICGNNILVHLEQGNNLNIRLINLLDYTLKKDIGLKKDYFFFKKSYNRKQAKAISQNTFEEKMKNFDKNKTVTEQEILDEYFYTDKTGKNSKIQIAITVKSEKITAVIDFIDAEQCENFVCPIWLTELIIPQIN